MVQVTITLGIFLHARQPIRRKSVSKIGKRVKKSPTPAVRTPNYKTIAYVSRV